MRRVTRTRNLKPAEAAKYRRARERVRDELPELLQRHQGRQSSAELLTQVLQVLKAAREERGLSLADLTRLTGMDRSALSKLETGQRLNPTLDTLTRYAEAVGKHLIVSVTGD